MLMTTSDEERKPPWPEFGRAGVHRLVLKRRGSSCEEETLVGAIANCRASVNDD